MLDSRRIIPETHRPLMTIGSIPGMGVFDMGGIIAPVGFPSALQHSM